MPNRPFLELVVPAEVRAALIVRARAEAPLECCGLLAGRVVAGRGMVEAIYPLVNAAASAVEFVSDARSMFTAIRDIDRSGQTILAVYHSHPSSRPVPSRTDLERSYSSDVVNIIISLQTEPAELKAWWFNDNSYYAAQYSISATVP